MSAYEKMLDATPGRGLQRRWRTLRKPDIVSIHGVKVKIDPAWATPEIRRGLYAGWYEKPEAEAVRRTLFPYDRYFEVGAGIGVVTAVACSLTGAVTAFEANPRLIEAIETNAASLNGYRPEVINAILGSDEGPKDFFVQEDFWASSMDPAGGGERVSVPGRSFEGELVRTGATYLMLDIEGAEVELLTSITLPERVRAICMEVHPAAVGRAETQRMIRHLEDQRFAVNFLVSGMCTAFFNRL